MAARQSEADGSSKSFKLKSMEQVDLLVVGGGINGVGIARDAAGRGLSVILVEKDDLAAHTSSASISNRRLTAFQFNGNGNRSERILPR